MKKDKSGFGNGPAGQQLTNVQQAIDDGCIVHTNNNGIVGFDANSIGTETTIINLDTVNIRKLEIDAKEIIMDLDIGRAEIILERLSMAGLKRFIEHCDEMKCLAERMLLQNS